MRVRHVQVVRPEVDHHLEQLALAPHGADDRGLPQRVHQVPGAPQGLEGVLHAHPEIGVPVGHVVLAEGVVQRGRIELPVEPSAAAESPDLLHQLMRGSVRGSPEQVHVGSARRE